MSWCFNAYQRRQKLRSNLEYIKILLGVIMHLISLQEHRTNEEIRRITGINDALEKARELKWDYAGHVMRMNTLRLPRLIYNWTPNDGRRKAGHQQVGLCRTLER